MKIFSDREARQLLRGGFDAAIVRANAADAVIRNLPGKPEGKCIVIGAGKASAKMAAAIDAAWPDVDLHGLVVTSYGNSVPAGRIGVMEANHPVPDTNSLIAANRIINLVQGLQCDDLVIALISGGGSSLLCSPRRGLTLEDKRDVHRSLLKSGLSIADMNIIRAHLSDIKGGRLAAAARPARLVTLVMSDIPGDNPALVSSGPTIPFATQDEPPGQIVKRHGIGLPADVIRLLAVARPPPPSNPRSEVRLIATPIESLRAAAMFFENAGVPALILGDAIEGDSREAATVMGCIARAAKLHGVPQKPPVVLLSGGETTVNFRGVSPGRGGRNTDFLLALAEKLNGEPGIWVLAGDTDGIDGSEDAAGAIIGPDTLERGLARRLTIQTSLGGFDSYSYFEALGDLIRTGPTHTNVNDFRALLVT